MVKYPGDVFQKRTGSLNFSRISISNETNTSYGIGDCQARCWSNCNCTGFMSLTDDGIGCIYFSGKSLDGITLNDTGRMFYLLVKKPQHRGTKKWIWIGVVVATALLAICSSIICLAINKRKHVLEDKRRKIMKTGIQDSTASDESTSIEDFEDDLNKGHDFKVFSYASIMEATSNFSSENNGYMAPEYAMEGIFSTKSDVYSFGVLLLEIVSGRRNNSFYEADHPLNLVGHAWELWNMGESLKLMDPSLNDTFVHDEVQRCIHVGLLCVEHYAKDRPNMLDIISMLTNKSAAVTIPRGPAFYVRRQTLEGELFSKSIEFDINSTKEISTSTEVEAR
ncbi:hypothetical protein RIF29_30709 [Crotalaria pallida]|uniref:Uncharacterized protein n=1 Tax=Crotalaria pallida TaxID=3830 RepID=A0AAN9EIK2_CROPI